MVMGKGRGSGAATVLLFCMLMFYSDMVHATSYVVGEVSGGWAFNVINWPKGKIFKTGDTLVFNYDASIHNVAVVDEAGYNSCQASPGSTVYRAGHDTITLPKGQNYFICSIPGHCQKNMKITVNAT